MTVIWDVFWFLAQVGGIALAIIAYACLVVVLTALFVPFVYRFSAAFGGAQAQDGSAVNARISWLFGLVVLDVADEIRLKVMGVPFVLSSPKSKLSTPEPKYSQTQPFILNEQSKKESEKEINQETNQETNQEINTGSKKRDKSSKKKVKQGRKSNVSLVKEIINYPDKGIVLRELCKMLRDLLRTSAPGFFEISGRFGFDTPEYTGYVTAALSSVQPFLGRRFLVDMLPDFGRKHFEAVVNARGSIKVFSVIAPVARFAASAPIRRLIAGLLKRRSAPKKKAKKGDKPIVQHF